VVVKIACSCDSQDCLSLSIIVLVVLSVVFRLAAKECCQLWKKFSFGSFQMLWTSLYLFNHTSKFQSYSDVKIFWWSSPVFRNLCVASRYHICHEFLYIFLFYILRLYFEYGKILHLNSRCLLPLKICLLHFCSNGTPHSSIVTDVMQVLIL
jgi:hypothetical protein